LAAHPRLGTYKDAIPLPPQRRTARSWAAPARLPRLRGRRPDAVVRAGGPGNLLAILAGFTILFPHPRAGGIGERHLENLIPTVSVVHPKRTPAQIQLELPGNITAFEEAPIYARVSGYLKQWYTDIGTHVVTGQPLAEIETPELDQELNQANAALAQANANLEIARISAERWQTLRKSDSVSQQDTDVRVATWHAREADVQAAGGQRQATEGIVQLQKTARAVSRHHHRSHHGCRAP
jgi:multidrug efflux pump subunit AcrA (membrane-fusion protein)